MNLYIDVGNTLTKVAFDEGNSIKFLFAVETYLVKEDATNAFMEYEEYLLKDIDNIFVSSVVPKAFKEISDYAKTSLKYKAIYKVGHSYKSNVVIDIDNPKELGNDLLCDLEGAYQIYGPSTLVVDMGTATKFLLIDDKGVFSTCAFVAGLELSLKSLASNTALLPKLEFNKAKPLLENRNTKDVMLSSAFYSQIDMINGMVGRYKKEVNYPIKVVVTGGNVNLIKEYFDFKYELEDNLCLKGLKFLSKLRK